MALCERFSVKWASEAMSDTFAVTTNGELTDPRAARRFKVGGGGGEDDTTVECGAPRRHAWVPTRLTSPYKVLTANVLQNDFYSSCVSWGRESIAVGLLNEILVLHQEKTRFIAAVEDVTFDSTTLSSPLMSGAVRPTTVSVLREADTQVLLGLSNGEVHLLEGRRDGTFLRRQSFHMPSSPFASYFPHPRGGDDFVRLRHSPHPTPLQDQFAGDGSAAHSEEWRRCSELLCQHAEAVMSVGCSATSAMLPHEVVVGTAANGLVLLDIRMASPALVLGPREYSPPRAMGYSKYAGPSTALAASLQRQERLCGVTWSANGSYVAAGAADGTVKIWSLSSPKEPLHRIAVDADYAVKAVAFHPCQPYELSLGSSAGCCGVRVYDVSTHTPQLQYVGATCTPITQLVYSPDGGHVVTAHGSRRSAESHYNLQHYMPSPTTSTIEKKSAWDSGAANEDPPLTTPSLTQHDASHAHGTGRPSPNGGPLRTASYCLAVWRRGKRRPCPVPAPSSLQLCETEEGPSGGPAPLALLPSHLLTGHKDRPLYLAAPSAEDGPSRGHVASASGGRDKSLRFWKVFQTSDSG